LGSPADRLEGQAETKKGRSVASKSSSPQAVFAAQRKLNQAKIHVKRNFARIDNFFI
jgi:hypothetical protein